MAEETFGVSLEQHLANRAGMGTTPQTQGAWGKYIGGPTNQMMQTALAPLQSMAGQVMQGQMNPAQVLQDFKSAARGETEPGATAQLLNPWSTATKAGILTGTAAAGGGAAAMQLPQVMQVASRVMGGTAGGLMSGAAEGGPAGGLAGAAEGMTTGAMGEVIGKSADFLRQIGVDRARRAAQEMDARRVVEAIRGNAKLGGVFNQHLDPRNPSKSIEELFHGYIKDPVTGRAKSKAQALLSQRMQQFDDEIQTILKAKAPSAQFPLFTEGRPSKGTTTPTRPGADLLEDLLTKSQTQSTQARLGQFGTWEEARGGLSMLGELAARAKPHQDFIINGQSLTGTQVKQLYADAIRTFQQRLTSVGDPKALQLFNDGRAMYEAGQYLSKKMPQAFVNMGADVIEFNSDALQRSLAKKRAEGVNKLGEEGFWGLGGAVRMTPETVGRRDVFQPTGLAAAAGGAIPGHTGAFARSQLGRPALVSPGGRNPLSLSDAKRTGITLAAEQMSYPVADYIAQQVQGIPGLSR